MSDDAEEAPPPKAKASAKKPKAAQKGGQAEIGRQGQEEVMISSQSWIR